LARRWSPALGTAGGPRPLALAGRVLGPFALVALPWYALCALRNGRAFLIEFFWRHHVLRLTSTELMHVQPWWYYLPVLAAALLPWTPLLLLAARRAPGRDARRWFLWAWLGFGLVALSAAVNKLPGYLLPLLPPAALLAALALEECPRPGPWLAACAVLLGSFLWAAAALPRSLASGRLSLRPLPAWEGIGLAPVLLAAAVWALARRGPRLAAAAAIAVGAAACVFYLKQQAVPATGRAASARTLGLQVAPHAAETCVDSLPRDWRYGLNYYSGTPLPDCADQPRPLRVRQVPGGPPFVAGAQEFRLPLSPGVH
jgi:4-amino-4-deoxy-L-arabinose transferase-like glycosyltransferase